MILSRTVRYLACLSALLLAGCGDGGTETEQASDTGIAQTALIKGADLAKDWKETRPLPFDLCGSDPFRGAAAKLETHYSAGLSDLQQQVAVFDSEAGAKKAYAELTSQRGFDCFRKGSESEVSAYSEGQILKRLKVRQRQSLGSVGEAKRTSVEVESPIGPAVVYIDVSHAQAGRTVSYLKISSGLVPVARWFFRKMVRLAAQRVESASGA